MNCRAENQTPIYLSRAVNKNIAFKMKAIVIIAYKLHVQMCD